MSITFYSEDEFNVVQKQLKSYQILFDNIETSLRNYYGDKISNDDVLRSKFEDCYNFIPKLNSNFFNQLEIVNKILHTEDKPRITFLDVGCGVGSKLAIAKLFYFSNVHGIEINPIYIDNAKKIFNICKENIFVVDALNFENYNEYDIIYFYCPFRNWELEKKLEIKIKNDMKSGSFLLANLSKTFYTKNTKQCFEINKKFTLVSELNECQILRKK